MNLFYLDDDFEKNAEYHIDKHVAKMVLETMEMICMAHYVNKVVGHVPRKLEKDEYVEVCQYKNQFRSTPPENREIPYIGRDAHLNHPSTVWVRSSFGNYEWAWCYAYALEHERRFRNPNGVSCHKAIRLGETLPDLKIPSTGLTPFALAMGALRDKYPWLVDGNDVVGSYRRFYMLDKASFASWKHRSPPPWWDERFMQEYGTLR